MIVVNYIYYCMYCVVTTFNKKPNGQGRALLLFSAALACYIISFLDFAGLWHRANSQAGNYTLVIFGLSLLFSRLYFYSSDRNNTIVDYFNEKLDEKNKIHAIIGVLLFFIGGSLVIIGSDYLH